MIARMIKCLVALGCVLTIAGTAAALVYDSRLSEINQTLERSGQTYTNDAAWRFAQEEQRNRLATYVPASMAVAVIGVALMGGVPLAIVIRRWRAGELDAPSKKAAVTFAAGALLLIAGTISYLAAGARLATVNKELDRLYAEPPSEVEDWDDKFGLEWEKNQLGDRLGWFGAMVAIGMVLTVVPVVWTWRRIGKERVENADSA